MLLFDSFYGLDCFMTFNKSHKIKMTMQRFMKCLWPNMVKPMEAKLFPKSAKIPGGNYFTIQRQTGVLGNPFFGKPLIWQLHIEKCHVHNYILTLQDICQTTFSYHSLERNKWRRLWQKLKYNYYRNQED